jgi:hypothetical protein
MLITYRRTGGPFALLTLATVAIAATVLTMAAAATLAVATAAALIGRAVVPRSWRNRTVPLATPWPHTTLDATVVNATSPSEMHNLSQIGHDSR